MMHVPLSEWMTTSNTGSCLNPVPRTGGLRISRKRSWPRVVGVSYVADADSWELGDGAATAVAVGVDLWWMLCKRPAIKNVSMSSERTFAGMLEARRRVSLVTFLRKTPAPPANRAGDICIIRQLTIIFSGDQQQPTMARSNSSSSAIHGVQKVFTLLPNFHL
jgi:hypothetical protein